ncbi:MAG: hypothetical protein WBB01_12510 [Phormidesmis sp.]
MKYWKPIAIFLISLTAVVVFTQIRSVPSPQGTPAKQGSIEGLARQYDSSCLLPSQESRPVWECYEISVEESPHRAVVVQHTSGEQYKVSTFQQNGQTKFRFTPTQKGIWSFSTGGEIAINANRPAYAKGFVAAQGNKWIRTATEEAFVPQYAMYDKPDIEAGLEEFVEGHGFSGFHIINLRDFMKNPSYFEAVVLETYRRGGVTHFWIWGDEQRNLTPSTYGVDVDLLYTEIAARLAPLPGWTVGYGFDLFEWATAREIENFRRKLRSDCDYPHLVGGRGHKNQYEEISSNLDYAAWEWHHPDYQDYRDHLEKSNQRPAFSEDRFRIWGSGHARDYNLDQTRQGLWLSAIAGGVANIWGHQPEGQEFSAPYANKEEIKTYSQFINANFTVGMEPDNDLVSTGYCLRDNNHAAICYSEQPDTIQFNLGEISTPTQVTAVDTRSAYQEIEVPLSDRNLRWQPPYLSDWAFHILGQSDGEPA